MAAATVVENRKCHIGTYLCNKLSGIKTKFHEDGSISLEVIPIFGFPDDSSYLSHRHQTFHFSGKASANYSVDRIVPQGSVLAPSLVSSQTPKTLSTSSTVMMCGHFYADDMQLYASCHLDNFSDVRLQLPACAADVSQWCASRRLQMNSDKTEIV